MVLNSNYSSILFLNLLTKFTILNKKNNCVLYVSIKLIMSIAFHDKVQAILNLFIL